MEQHVYDSIAFVHEGKCFMRRGNVLYVDGCEFGQIIGDHILTNENTLFGSFINGQFKHLSELFAQSHNTKTKTDDTRIPQTLERKEENDDFVPRPVVAERKPISDVKRSLYQRFALPIVQYIQSVETSLDSTALRTTFRNNLIAENPSHYKRVPLAIQAGFRHIDIEDVYKSIMMTVPEDESILSVNGYLAYYPSKFNVKSDASNNKTIEYAQRTYFNDSFEQFVIFIETEESVYECKPSMTFRYEDDRSKMLVYSNGYHERMDKHQRFLNTDSDGVQGYLCLKNPQAGYYYRIRDRFIPYCVQRYPKRKGIVLQTVVRIHPLEFGASANDFDTILQRDYEELMEMRKQAGICVPRMVVVYDD